MADPVAATEAMTVLHSTWWDGRLLDGTRVGNVYSSLAMKATDWIHP